MFGVNVLHINYKFGVSELDIPSLIELVITMKMSLTRSKGAMIVLATHPATPPQKNEIPHRLLSDYSISFIFN